MEVESVIREREIEGERGELLTSVSRMDGIQLESKSASGLDVDPLDWVEAILNILIDVEDRRSRRSCSFRGLDTHSSQS